MTGAPKVKPLAERPYLSGAMFWILFAMVAVLLRGVRWDENYEFAQVILGHVPYPDGHPLKQYVQTFLSLQTYALAALMYVVPEPFPANFLRNWCFLASSTVPVFLLGALFSRRQIIGHIAAILILLEIHVTFYTAYPIHVWPGVFSNGPIGLGYMLLGLWALLDRRYRLAGMLAGLAPAIHLGQFPPLLAVLVLYGMFLARTGRHRALRRLAVWALPGVALTVCFALVLHLSAAQPPTAGPYFTPGAPLDLWHTYMARYASHRALPFTTGHLVLILAVLTALALLVYRRWGRAPEKSPPDLLEFPESWALIYCGVICLLVWGIMLVHVVLQADIPFLLAGWLPYRLMNHVAPVLIPLLLALGYRQDNRIPAYLPLLLLAALLAPLLHLTVPHETVERYITPNAYLFFMLAGAVAGTGIVLAARSGWRAAAAGAAALMAALAALVWVHQFGAACLALGAALACLCAAIRVPERLLQVSSVVLACLLVAAMLGKSRERRVDLPRTAFHRDVARYLDRSGEPDAMILVGHHQVGDQMQFGHPVMADMATLLFAAYRPALGPAVNAVFQDFYGISLDPAAAPSPLAWYEVWPAKSIEEWRALSEKYAFRYIAAPRFIQLPLDRVVEDRQFILYRIP